MDVMFYVCTSHIIFSIGIFSPVIFGRFSVVCFSIIYLNIDFHIIISTEMFTCSFVWETRSRYKEKKCHCFIVTHHSPMHMQRYHFCIICMYRWVMNGIIPLTNCEHEYLMWLYGWMKNKLHFVNCEKVNWSIVCLIVSLHEKAPNDAKQQQT